MRLLFALVARDFLTPLVSFLTAPLAEILALRGVDFGDVVWPLGMEKWPAPDLIAVLRILMRCSEIARAVGACWSLAVES